MVQETDLQESAVAAEVEPGEGSPLSSETLDMLFESSACPPIHSAIPDWPFRNKQKSFWLPLSREGMIFLHQPILTRQDHLSDDQQDFKSQPFNEIGPESFFCNPEPESRRLEAVLRRSHGGSVLVTGYRGTGKSSLVNYTIRRLLEGQDASGDSNAGSRVPSHEFVPVRVNLSSSRTARALVFLMIKRIFELKERKRFGDIRAALALRIDRIYARSLGAQVMESGSTTGKELNATTSMKLAPFLINLMSAGGELGANYSDESSEKTSQSVDPYTLYEAQQDLHDCLNSLRRAGFALIFILDELDKLTPATNQSEARPLHEMQRMVADLKPLLTETSAYYIFIAGKDVDDSWQEDQNKGEGLFESAFVQNIYLPSMLTAELRPTIGPHRSWIHEPWKQAMEDNADIKKRMREENQTEEDVLGIWTRDLMRAVLEELAIDSKSWTYNTGLLILPHFGKSVFEKILRRIWYRTGGKSLRKLDSRGDRPDGLPEWLWHLAKELTPGTEDEASYHEEIITERRCRRIRYLLQYFTYKGRGMPRKVLREFYGLVTSPASLSHKTPTYLKRKKLEPEDYILNLRTTTRQKLKFFSSIVARLESEPEIFRTLDDKACVATFHIIDYILKFYRTGFSWTDIEYAKFMSKRQDLLASRVLVATILKILEGFLVERSDPRSQEYRLLPRIKHDLACLYLAFGPEQIELRFTAGESRDEIQELKRTTEKLDRTHPDQRLESFTAQIRLAKIYEDLGDFGAARRAYGKAIRGIRMDIARLRAAQADQIRTHAGDRNNQENTERIGGALLESAEIITYLSYAVEILQRMGYLNEVVREYEQAAHYYREAVRLNEVAWLMARGDSTREGQLFLDDLSFGGSSNSEKMESLRQEREEARSDSESSTRKRVSIPLSLLGGRIDLAEQDVGGESSDEHVGEFSRLLDTMLSKEQAVQDVLRFTDRIPLDMSQIRPLYTSHDPYGLPRTLNLLALACEKMLHRYACNRFLLLSLNYYCRIADRYGMIQQMILIAELQARRRDLRTAAQWYLYAVKVLDRMQIQDGVNRIGRIPEFRSSVRGMLFERLGDIYYATEGLALLPSKVMDDFELDAECEHWRNIREELRDMRWQVFEDRDEELFYSMAVEAYRADVDALALAAVYQKTLLSKTRI